MLSSELLSLILYRVRILFEPALCEDTSKYNMESSDESDGDESDGFWH